jgi:hypothetical protein
MSAVGGKRDAGGGEEGDEVVLPCANIVRLAGLVLWF